MKIVQVRVANFRGIAQGTVHFDGHSVLVGDNNAGKSTLLEAIDLVLGPERLSRRPVVDEHDFYAGQYLSAEGQPIPLSVEVIVADLNEEQLRHFREHLEWWDTNAKTLLPGPPAEGTDAAGVGPALRVFFRGAYDAEEDDFLGNTFFALPAPIGAGEYQALRASDKRKCGFLYLRTVRTGSRALSLERGSLLDVILRLQESRLKMWEELLGSLRTLPVAEKPELGVTTLLAAVQASIRKFVPSDWAEDPHMRVSDLTRETLRRTLTVFMGTGVKRPDGSSYAAPYQHQGTGTINTLVLALLSIIAELKQNVIFAMEEPETALPPHTQKRIVNSVREKSAQALFTSHSPYVLEEFEPAQIKVLKRAGGVLTSVPASLPPTIKPKAYKAEFRARFCEALLAKYVLIVEGRTEFDALPAAARTLSQTDPQYFKSLEALGVAVIDARTDSQVAPLGNFFRALGKTVFAVFDKQDEAQLALIRAAVDHTYESPTKGFESLVLQGTNENAIRRYALSVVADGDWPQHLIPVAPRADSDLAALRNALTQYFAWGKGSGQAADLLASCTGWQEMPEYVAKTLYGIFLVVEPAPPAPPAEAAAA
ncbi:ATP-dependent nuclease [Variovorax sp. RT4R15]|uniref:ATP-dependent nuclease n=1 Tax=Variovorax sp. RT4R15 TaxID=3443737 RepID=UPI003F46E47B